MLRPWFSLAAGTVAMADGPAWTGAKVRLFAASVALIPLGLGVIRAASGKTG
jgi:hypothetical protein